MQPGCCRPLDWATCLRDICAYWRAIDGRACRRAQPATRNCVREGSGAKWFRSPPCMTIGRSGVQAIPVNAKMVSAVPLKEISNVSEGAAGCTDVKIVTGLFIAPRCSRPADRTSSRGSLRSVTECKVHRCSRRQGQPHAAHGCARTGPRRWRSGSSRCKQYHCQ